MHQDNQRFHKKAHLINAQNKWVINYRIEQEKTIQSKVLFDTYFSLLSNVAKEFERK